MASDKKELSLQEIHDATLNLLVKTKNICDEIGVKYYLAYGTLLGAVRHKGFIPWDDDADLWMTREDYDYFFEYMKTHKDTLYPIGYCSRKTTKNYPFGINRITDLRYKYVDIKTYIDVDYGIFVDVYPLDAVGNTRKDYMKMYNKIEKFNSMYFVYLQNKSYSGNKIKDIFKQICHTFLKIHFKEQSDILDYIEDKTKDVVKSHELKDSRLVGVVIWWAYIQCYDKSLFEERTSLELGGEEFSVPKRYDELLYLIYGDYMKLPPEEKRIPYHGYKIYKR